MSEKETPCDGVSRNFHIRLDIRGALLNWEDRMFRGMFKTDDGRTMEPREAKLQLMEELQKGNNYIPYGDCEGFDPKEKGCPGHASWDSKAQKLLEGKE